MRARFFEDSRVQFPVAPAIGQRLRISPRRHASKLDETLKGRVGLALYLEIFRLGWICGFLAGAGIAAVLLHR